MFHSRCGILTEEISIASTSLQQRQSISLTSFLQCRHLYQSRFPILICNKLAAETWICWVSLSCLALPHSFFCSGSNRNGWRMMERKSSFPLVFSSEQSFSSLKYKSDTVFSVFLSLGQNLIKLEKWSYHLYNNKFLTILKTYVHYLRHKVISQR